MQDNRRLHRLLNQGTAAAVCHVERIEMAEGLYGKAGYGVATLQAEEEIRPSVGHDMVDLAEALGNQAELLDLLTQRLGPVIRQSSPADQSARADAVPDSRSELAGEINKSVGRVRAQCAHIHWLLANLDI